ncbi:MAG TPA: tRNA lysidine(34) synthetase TilS [Planctomycetota bacterium]|nr:tRNA lysidine(34) synthetase TilS [Planctomycetota bacterium]
MELTNQIWNLIRANNLFQPGQTIIIGLSGGPDSVTLTHLLSRINTCFKMDWRLVIAHLNHRMRGRKSDRDERFARKMAARLGIPIYISRRNIIKLSKQYKQSPEETARYERYRFFTDIAKQIAKKHRKQTISVAVGHNLDDNAETVLFRIIRGTGLKGLRGIRPKRELFTGSRFHLVRPLAFTSRQEIIAYLKAQKLPYCIDHTNQDKKMLRNRIRHELLPLLKKYNPAICRHLVQLSETASAHYDYLDKTVQAKLSRKQGSLALKTLKKEHPIIQTEMLTKALENIAGTKALTYIHYQALLKLINSPKPGGEIHLPDNIIARVKSGKLIFKRTNNRQN